MTGYTMNTYINPDELLHQKDSVKKTGETPAYSAKPITFKRKKAYMSFERETRILKDYDAIHDIGHPSIIRNAKGFQVFTDRKLTDEEKQDLKWELMFPNLIFAYRNS